MVTSPWTTSELNSQSLRKGHATIANDIMKRSVFEEEIDITEPLVIRDARVQCQMMRNLLLLRSERLDIQDLRI